MSKHQLRPQGDFPPASLIRRLAAMFYDFLLCVAMAIVVGLIYKMCQIAIYGEEHMRQLTDSGALNSEPLLQSILLACLFAFFAKFWTHNGQTLGMQVWGIRIQNKDGSAIDLWQALLRFFIAIPSFFLGGLGYLWMLRDKDRRTWHDRYSDSVVVQLPKKPKR